ncbi:hypothetical protein K2173_007308 [Erythroxylum novogranatense]|uniref:BZIP domain-containing protein n=1 Tax=Erythroxylum novogranatense TaxID=1862640 RepID=A0AAV8T7C7_9ROSI|nr:hypothetical protein K2173_007308 [Erythroxylum novogranatense]
MASWTLIYMSHPSNYLNSSPDSVTSTIEEIENFLMNDDEYSYDLQSSLELCDNFLADVIVDSPSLGKVSTGSDHGNDTSSEKVVREKVNDYEFDGAATAGPDEPMSKKRRRQLRNRDAAVRSRERRKIRLGRTLQCYVAENQALQLSLQAFGVSSTKQESAVLLLESLLLGSLLWFLGIMCLFILPSSTLVPVSPDEEGKMAKNVDPREGGSDNLTLLETPSFLNSRRCKASRTRMRIGSHFLVI